MRRSRFKTCAVYDHASRALDELRRMGFVLVSMTVATESQDVAEVCIDYEPRGNLSADTWFRRVSRLSGAFDFCDTSADDPVTQDAGDNRLGSAFGK